MHEVASQFNDEVFLMKLAYLIDIFEKLNDLNLQLQGSFKVEANIQPNKISAFT